MKRHRLPLTNWLPSDMAPKDLQLWVNSDAWTLDGNGNVQTWTDQSGNGNDLTSTGATVRPTVQASVQPPFKSARFDGVDDYLACAGLVIAQPFDVWMVLRAWKPRDVGSNEWCTWHALNAVAQDWDTPTVNCIPFAGVNLPISTLRASGGFGAWDIVRWTFDGASSAYVRNGTVLGTGNPGAGGINGFALAASPFGLFNSPIGVSELLITPGATPSLRNLIYLYLSQRNPTNAGAQ